MRNAFKKGKRTSVIYAVIAFVVLLGVTQLLVYQRYSSIREAEHHELLHELNDTKDQLRVILDHNLSSATTVSILYKQSRTLTWFDSVAKELLAMNKAIDIVYFVDKDLTITNVYPLEGNEPILGFSLLSDPHRAAEAKLALSQDKIVFGGPYDMRQGGGKAIAGRLPLFENGQFIGGSVVVTKLSTIRKRMPELENKGDKFVYQLSKENVLTGKREYFFDGYRPQQDREAYAYISSGNWILHAAYVEGYASPKTVTLLSLFGLLFSIMGAVFVYSKTYAPVHLAAMVRQQTHDLGERMKELSTIYKVNEVLRDEMQSTDIAMSRIVKMLPAGWQYPEICAARIVIGEIEYKTENYCDTKYKMQAPLTISDGRTGFVEVSYTKKAPRAADSPFLDEERTLINSLAETIEVYYNSKWRRERIARSEATLRSMVETCPMGVVLIDMNFQIMAINSNMATNYPINTGREMSVGDNFIEALLPDRREAVRKTFETVMERLEPVEYDTSYPKGNEAVWFTVSVAPVVVNAEAIGVCLVGYDITRRKRLELEHEHIIRDLMQHMTTLVEFTRALNHKVREPLEEIPRQVERVKGEKDEQQRLVILDEISKNAQYVASYVKELDEAVDEKKNKQRKPTRGEGERSES